MRSRVVAFRDIAEKFGAEVKTFPYAFVIARHAPGWEHLPLVPESLATPALPALSAEPVDGFEGATVTSKLRPGKSPVYIEVKARA